MTKPVKVRSAPGLVWKKRRNGHEARWQARTDMVAKGFQIKSMKLWTDRYGRLLCMDGWKPAGLIRSSPYQRSQISKRFSIAKTIRRSRSCRTAAFAGSSFNASSGETS